MGATNRRHTRVRFRELPATPNKSANEPLTIPDAAHQLADSNAVQSKLDEVRRSMNNLLDAIEKMGYAPHIQDRYDERKREASELLAEMVSLEA